MGWAGSRARSTGWVGRLDRKEKEGKPFRLLDVVSPQLFLMPPPPLDSSSPPPR